jgi:ribosomal protein S18 acetylase RimI-like enzyme
MIELYTVQPSDGALLREVMLRMYADSPRAFGETLAQAQVRTDTGWADLAAMVSDPTRYVAFLARQDGHSVGYKPSVGYMVGMLGRYLDGRLNYAPTDTVTIGRTWVAPEWRGQRLSDRLLDAVASWARGKGARRLELQVTEDNPYAIRFFERAGFTATGHHEPFPPNPQVQMRYMAREP